jgi:PAS domain S-box-containing protein
MDISERKRSEDSLRESQERLDLALKGADLGLWDLDLTTGLGVVNERMPEIIEYTQGELETGLEDWQRLIHPDDIRCVREHINEHLEGRADFIDHEYRIRTKCGRYVWVLARGRVVKRSSDGRPLRMAGTAMDITLRKRAEEELQSTVSRFYAILSSLYGGVLLVTNDGDVEFANEAFCNLFGLDDAPINLRGLKAPEIIDKIKKVYADPDNALFRIREIISENRPVKFEEIGIVGGGTYARDFIPITLNGKLYGRFWHHTDITDRKQTEDAPWLKASANTVYYSTKLLWE